MLLPDATTYRGPASTGRLDYATDRVHAQVTVPLDDYEWTAAGPHMVELSTTVGWAGRQSQIVVALAPAAQRVLAAHLIASLGAGDVLKLAAAHARVLAEDRAAERQELDNIWDDMSEDGDGKGLMLKLLNDLDDFKDDHAHRILKLAGLVDQGQPEGEAQLTVVPSD